jgi:hypothetical protein
MTSSTVAKAPACGAGCVQVIGLSTAAQMFPCNRAEAVN